MTDFLDIDTFYTLMDRNLKLVDAYCGWSRISAVLKMCRAKPYLPLLTQDFERTTLSKIWIDEYGTSIHIGKGIDLDSYKIKPHNLRINKERGGFTDLYAGLPPKKIQKISKMMFVLVGKDEILGSDHFIVSFLGIDNYLRTFVYSNEKWRSYSSLCLGIRILRRIARHAQPIIKKKKRKEWGKRKCKEQFKMELDITGTILFPCTEQKMWLVSLPMNKVTTRILTRNNIQLY